MVLASVLPERGPAAAAARPGRPEDNDPRRRAAIATIASRLTTSILNRTYIILVTVETPNAALSAQIANTIADFYLVDQLDAKYDANKRATEWLEERLRDLRRNLQAAEDAVALYRHDKGLAGSPEGAVSSQTLTDLNGKYTAARARRIEREARLVALSRASVNPAELANIAEVSANATLAALRMQDVELNRRVSEFSDKYGDNHPRMVQTRSELASVRGRIKAETDRIAMGIRAELEAARSEEEQLKQQLEKASTTSGEASQYEAELKQLEREAQSNRAIFESFMTRFKELREQQDIQRPDARVLTYAQPSSAPSWPQYQASLFAAFVIGCLFGMGGAIGAEKLDRGFRAASQVEKATGFAVLGMIPLIKGPAGARASAVGRVLDRTTSSVAEALRSVFTAITLSNLDRPARIIAVTSSTPGEGKTTIAAALGGLLTKMNASRRVLIVDLDLRQAKLADALGLPAKAGTIDEYLLGTRPLEECVQRHEASGLDYICARRNTPNAPDILESAAMKSALALFVERYDLVLLDSPPVMAVADARIVSSLADYTIFLVFWAKTPREIVINAINVLKTTTDRVGIVINKVDLSKHARYGYGDYGYYYSRYQGYYNVPKSQRHEKSKKAA